MFDGSHVLATTRAITALSTRCNIINYDRRSWSYEARLIKYARRGFTIGAPKLRRGEVELRDSGPKTLSRSNLPKDHPMYLDMWLDDARGETPYAEWRNQCREAIEVYRVLYIWFQMGYLLLAA